MIERGREEFSWAKLKETFGGRSYCPSCKKTLQAWQLLPLFGWLLQK
ncbi:MAG: prepilin peptidase [Candidatus Peribacteria bacterium]|nr:MAG: prepilin peptidase [Candidatus Peribacteria bacterium]